MIIEINYMDVYALINTNTQEILIKDHINNENLFNMVYKSILNKVNINIDNYTIVRTNS